MNTLILGIGNTLLSDEGVGIHLLHYLEQHYAWPNVTFLDGGTLSFSLAPIIEEMDALLVLDAAALKSEAGATRCFRDQEMDYFLNTHERGVHEVGLMDVLTIVTLTERLPQQRALVGIQPEKLTWGESLTPAVAAAFPVAAGLAETVLREWKVLE